tara:strand:+ start:2564 stop:2827 length:264 start_codon:yes stop_codon:yes gene_type:complete
MVSIDNWLFKPGQSIYCGPNGETVKWQTDPNLSIDWKTNTITNLKTREVMSIAEFICSGQTRVLYVLGPYGITPDQEDHIYNRDAFE